VRNGSHGWRRRGKAVLRRGVPISRRSALGRFCDGLSCPELLIRSSDGAGLPYCVLALRNPRNPQSGSVDVEALADTRAVYLIIPEHIRLQLALDEGREKEITLADGSKKMVPYVGPIETRFKNRMAYVGAVVMGDEVLLGAIPMEDMDLVVLRPQRRVDINPLNPNFAAAQAK
jgi:clan AA aspartic protease